MRFANFLPISGNKGNTEGTRPTRSKYILIYLALAAVNILTISLSLHFNHRLTSMYKESVHQSEYWTDRLGDYSELNKIAIQVNTPGNSVFESKDTNQELKNLEAAEKSFENSIGQARIKLLEFASKEQSIRLMQGLDLVDDNMEKVSQGTRSIFILLEQNQSDQAAALIASVGDSYNQCVQAIDELLHDVRNIQESNLKRQSAQARSLATFEYVLVILIAVMIASVLAYGQKMSSHMKQAALAAEETSKALKQSEERERSIIDTAMDAVILADWNGIITRWNKHAELIYGWTSKEAIGQQFSSLIFAPGESNRLEGELKQFLILGNGPFLTERVETTGIRKDITSFPIELSASRIRQGNETWLSIFVRDITDRRKSEQQLTEAKESAEAVLRELTLQQFALDQHAIVAITDPHGTITYANERFCAISKYEHSELIGENHSLLNSGYHDKAFFKEMWSTIKSGNVWNGELRNKAKDGTCYWVNSTIVPFKAPDGKIERYIAIREDITERKQTEDALLEAKEAAEKANGAKSEFLATMSHEIRTPMNGVIGFANLLMDSDLNHEQLDYTNTIKNSGEALLGIINDILDFSKIEAGKMEIEVIPFNLKESAEEAIELLASKCAENDIELLLRFDPETPQGIIADPGRVRQILVNLVSNAVKFTEYGHVFVDISPEPGKEYEFIRISVNDTGIGIPEDKQAALFQKFSQADSSTARKFGGTGLGLAISKLLSEMMGGRVGMESVEGEGSTFWFTLPIPREAIEFEEKSAAADVSNVRALIVDDYALTGELLGEQLESWNVQQQTTTSGAEALATLVAAAENGKPFDLAIIDYQMPDMNGKELGLRIQKDPKISNTKLIILAVGDRRQEATKLLDRGFSSTLLKPIAKPDQLRNAIARSLMKNTRQLDEYRKDEKSKQGREHERLRAIGSNRRALVVDDTTTNQMLLQTMLNRLYGFTVDIAANGQEAVEMVKQLPYDIVFMDCMMPVMDGYEATNAIRAAEANPDGHKGIAPDQRVPVIALTASAMKGDRERCLAAGMDDYLSKPVKPERLTIAIESWINQDKPKSTSDDPIFSIDSIREFFPDDQSMITSLLKTYRESLDEQIDTLKDTLSKEASKENIRYHAHTIKGSANELGAKALGSIADTMEVACIENNLEGALVHVDDLFEMAEATKSEIDRILNS